MTMEVLSDACEKCKDAPLFDDNGSYRGSLSDDQISLAAGSSFCILLCHFLPAAAGVKVA